jgi:prepilin-type N-terminal cleavage/methylation domain-containing protein
MMRSGYFSSKPRRASGFTLIEIAVVIVILGLLLALLAGMGTAMIGQQRREATRVKLAALETSLALFVSQNKRLPCPANGTFDSANTNAGIEQRSGGGACQVGGAANVQTNGVVPWRTLGLSEPDATDGWGNRISYRVAPELALLNAMDFTACDPGGSGALSGGVCNATCSAASFPGSCTPPQTYTAGKGLRVRNLNATVTLIMDYAAAPNSTGAAYVAISHGENGEGAYSASGTLQSGTTGSGTLELANAANSAFAGATSAAMPALVDDFPVYPAGTGHFDDFVLRPAILTVASKAQLGPRAH